MVFHAHIFDSVLSRLGVASSDCVKRTATRHQHAFDLSRPDPVTFDFSSGDPRSFEVAIPAHSAWSPVLTFHLDAAHCIAIYTLRGWTFLYSESIDRGSGSTRADPGYYLKQMPRSYLQWSNFDAWASSAVQITGDAQLYRTLCSVVQDAELYYRLCTTPLWIRLMFVILSHIPFYGKAAKERLIRLALYIQLRVVFYKNDCWTAQGTVRIDWYYWTAPDWVWQFQAWTTVLISQTTLCLLYWLGRLALGMRESYSDYNVPVMHEVVRSEKGKT